MCGRMVQGCIQWQRSTGTYLIAHALIRWGGEQIQTFQTFQGWKVAMHTYVFTFIYHATSRIPNQTLNNEEVTYSAELTSFNQEPWNSLHHIP